MRSLLAVAMVILALDLTMVAVDEFQRPVRPAIDAGMFGQDADQAEPQADLAATGRATPSDDLASRAPPPSASTRHPPAPSPAPTHRVTDVEPQADSADPTPSKQPPAPPTPTVAPPPPSPHRTPTVQEPPHGQVWSEDDGQLTVEIALPKTRFAPGETVPFTLRLCNRTDEDIRWGYPDHQERPLIFVFSDEKEPPNWAALRNGNRGGHTYSGPEAYVVIPAHDCLTWAGRWEQTLGEFGLDGSGAGQPFPPGELVAHLALDGAPEGGGIRHPEYQVTLLIG